MKWYLTLVQQYHDKPKSRRTWVLVTAEDGMGAREEGAQVAVVFWPLCRGSAAIVITSQTALRCRQWLQTTQKVLRPRCRPSELTVAYDALFCHGKRHPKLDAEMISRWTSKPAPAAPDPVRFEEEI